MDGSLGNIHKIQSNYPLLVLDAYHSVFG